MFFNNYPLAKNKDQKKNIIETDLLYRRFTLVALNNFEWINLPQTIKPRWIETALFYNGCAVFGYDDKYGYFALPSALTGDLDLYYEPKSWNVIGNSFNKHYDSSNSVIRSLISPTPFSS